jgi:lipid II:glycine glycyltransferase (peptidoglycan interpeptide bridge formation enzyme)
MAESNASLEIIEIQKSEFALWDEFVKNSPQGTFFHSTTWANIISESSGRKYKILFCIKKDQTVGGMLFFAHKKFLWRMITPIMLFPYNAPIFYQPAEEKPQRTIHHQLNISAKFENYLHQNYAYWIIDAPASNKDIRAYQWQGANVEPKYSYVVKLGNEKNLFDNFNQSVRRKLKQAEEQGIVVYESNEPETLIKLITKSYHRHGILPIFAENTFPLFLNKILELPQVKLFYSEINGKIIAARIVVVDEGTVFDLLAGSNDESGIGSAYLVSNVLEKFAASHQYFDFMGANNPQIEQFKRGFGGELVHGFRVTNKVKIPLTWLVQIYRYRLQKERIL